MRVAARRLRQKLDEYYAGEGRDDEVVVSLERGGYQPGFERRRGLPLTGADALPDAGGSGASAQRVEAAPAVALATGRRSITRGTWQRGAWLLALVAAVAAGAWWWNWRGHQPQPTQVIAVLPFTNATGDPANDPTCFGIVEDLTTALTSLEGIDVIARTSASQFSGKGTDLVQVGKKLGADLLVEGSVRRDSSRLFVTAQLIESRKGTHLWADEFEGRVADGVAAQQEIARSMYQALRDRLGRSGRSRPSRAVSPGALDLYWKGRFARAQRAADNLTKAVEFFSQAVALDPGYADARAALGEALASQAFHLNAPSPELLQRARTELNTALGQDPSSSSALAMVAWIAFFYDHDWAAAENGFRRALSINPSAASAHNLYALALMSRGRFDEAVEHARLALRYDPVRYAARNDYGVILWAARRYREAESAATGLLEADSTYHVAHVLRGIARIGLGDYPGAIADLEAVRAAMGSVSQVLARLVCAYAGQGNLALARARLEELKRERERDEALDTHLAFAYAALGDDAAALDRLERAEARHEADVNFIAVEPALDHLRTNPRFRALAIRLGLVDTAR